MINEEFIGIDNAIPALNTQIKTRYQNKEELYESIVNDIKQMYQNKLSEAQAHEAARNLIEYVKIAIEVASRQNMDN